jgi:hypothetical protein
LALDGFEWLTALPHRFTFKKENEYLWNRKMGETQGLPGLCGEEENFGPLPCFEQKIRSGFQYADIGDCCDGTISLAVS